MCPRPLLIPSLLNERSIFWLLPNMRTKAHNRTSADSFASVDVASLSCIRGRRSVQHTWDLAFIGTSKCKQRHVQMPLLGFGLPPTEPAAIRGEMEGKACTASIGFRTPGFVFASRFVSA